MDNSYQEELRFDKVAGEDLAWTPDLWFYELFQGTVSIGFRIKETVHTEKSPFQHIAVYDTYKHGLLLSLDGVVMLTERDEYIYHEMIAHVPMQTLPRARRAVVIGGGDGGTVRELAKYPDLESITLVEIDERVVEVCKKYMPEIASGFSDPRVECKFMDGAEFVKTADPESADLLIIDSTDPIGPGKVLFTEEFYRDCARVLSPEGVLAAQTETPFYHRAAIKEIYNNLGKAFGRAYMYWYAMPSYMGAVYTFAYASKTRHPLQDHTPRHLDRIACRYYNEALHSACFVLPGMVRESLPEGHPQREGRL